MAATVIICPRPVNEGHGSAGDLRLAIARITQVDSHFVARPDDQVVEAAARWRRPGKSSSAQIGNHLARALLESAP